METVVLPTMVARQLEIVMNLHTRGNIYNAPGRRTFRAQPTMVATTAMTTMMMTTTTTTGRSKSAGVRRHPGIV